MPVNYNTNLFTVKSQVEDEAAEVGRVSWRVYLHYLSKLGWPVALLVATAHVVSQFLLNGSSLWLAKWADAHHHHANGTG